MGCLLYAALFTFLGAVKYSAHRNLVDFGIFEQTISSAFGCFCNPVEGSHWAFHFSPILYLVAIALTIVRSPLTLVALQSIAGALCAPPVYGIVRARAGVSTARLAALVALLYPPLAGLVFGDFHENNFAPAAVAWSLYAFDAGSLAVSGLFAAVVLAVKEDQAIFLACAELGVALAYRSDPKRWRFAVGVAVVSLAIEALFFFVIEPHVTASPAWQPTRFYAWTVADWRALLPRGILERAGFLVLILAPLAFVPLRTRAIVIAVAPLLEVLTSRMSTTFTLGSHYAGAWIGYLFVAFAAGIGYLDEHNRAKRTLYWALAFCVVEFAVANPLHPGLNLRPRQPRDARLDAALAKLPPDASVATQEEAYTHIALENPNARLLPENPSADTEACFVLIDRDFPDSPRLQEYGPKLASLVREGRYVLVERDGGVELYRRNGDCR
ncbi:MAG TPA: DUF2079 domain-containing protein [Candidatus Baltobacteraceae bacterium]|nr:DUF2079 domain-containing protein [Candidatus Baltobacteraceae bacterium]